MKKLKLFYNPYSGDKSFKDNLDIVIHILQSEGDFEVSVVRVTDLNSIDDYFQKMDTQDLHCICVSGGDGSINIVVNAMKKYNVELPIGIFPAGTANDFATFLNIPKNIEEAARLIVAGNTKEIDIGKVSDKYFINVICIGLFASISQGVDIDLKNSIGKLAYYLQGVKVIANVKPMALTITTSVGTFNEDCYLVLVMNTSSAGGFDKLSPESSVTDGKFDLVVFRADSAPNAANAFFKVLSGKHIENDNVLYYQDSYFKISSRDDTNAYPETDVDGELGPSFPIEIHIVKGGISVFVPDDDNLLNRKPKNIKKQKKLN